MTDDSQTKQKRRKWMGILHLPLLVISLCALILPRIPERGARQVV